MNRIFIFLLYISLFGCSSPKKEQVPEQFRDLENLRVYSETVSPKARVTFTMEQTFVGSDSARIGKMGGIAVDSSDRVFIADVQSQSIQVFEPNGENITQLGREGRGPNEFLSIKSLHIQNHHLYAFDFSQNRVGTFNLVNFTDNKTIQLGGNKSEFDDLKGVYPSIDELFVRTDESYIAKFKTDSAITNKMWRNFEINGIYYPLDKTGSIQSEKLLDLKYATGTQVGVPPSTVLFAYHIKPFFGNILVSLSNDDGLFLAEPDHFLVKEYSSEGVYERAFYYTLDRVLLTPESAIKVGVSDIFVKNMNSMNLPKSWPVVTDMKIDDQDRLWVATTVEDVSVYEWWVLEETGELISRFSWPRDEPVKYIRNGKMYTHQTDNVSGMERIVRYRFELEEI